MTYAYEKIERILEEHEDVALFLDYDGTLADFTRHPDIVEPNPEVVKLVEALLDSENILPIIISGRRLSHLQKLLPFPNMILAGAYGLEIQFPGNELYYPLEYERIRPALQEIKLVWADLIEGEGPFYLEDKGWAVAIHARFVDDGTAEEILSQAQQIALDRLDARVFQVKSGDKFLEAKPIQADKGRCVSFLLIKLPLENTALLYLGDDDKDEQAFEVVHEHGGVAIRVCSSVIHNPIEDWRLDNPQAAREWLWTLIKR